MLAQVDGSLTLLTQKSHLLMLSIYVHARQRVSVNVFYIVILPSSRSVWIKLCGWWLKQKYDYKWVQMPQKMWEFDMTITRSRRKYSNFNILSSTRCNTLEWWPHHWPPTQFLGQRPPGITFQNLYKSLVISAFFENHTRHTTPSHVTQLHLFLPSNNLGNILHPQPTATIKNPPEFIARSKNMKSWIRGAIGVVWSSIGSTCMTLIIWPILIKLVKQI